MHNHRPTAAFVVVTMLLMIPPQAAGVTPMVDCEGTVAAYKVDRNYKHLNCYCPSKRSHPVCTDPRSGSGGSVPRSGGSKSKSKSYDPTMDVMQGVLGAIMAPPRKQDNAALKAQQQMLERQQQEREMQEAVDRAKQDALFRAGKEETMHSLKGGEDPGAILLKGNSPADELGLKPVPPSSASASPPSSATGALAELNCSAYWAAEALNAARLAGGVRLEDARRDAERSAQAHGARTGGCPPMPVRVPGVSAAEPPDRHQQVIRQAQQLETLFTRNHQKLAETKAKRDKTRQELERLKQEVKDPADPKDDEALRKAKEAELAQQKLMQELETLEQDISKTETEQKQLQDQLNNLERNHQATAPQP
jgi:hypothetical protein